MDERSLGAVFMIKDGSFAQLERGDIDLGTASKMFEQEALSLGLR